MEDGEIIIAPIAERAGRVENAQRFALIGVFDGLNAQIDAPCERNARENCAPFFRGAAERFG